MNDKLKLPLTAVFSFLLGGIVFFPWGANESVNLDRSVDSASTYIFDEIKTTNSQKESTTRIAKSTVKKVDYHFSASELKISNLAIKKQLNNSDLVAKTEISEQEDSKEQPIVANTDKVTAIIVVEYHFSKDELKLSNFTIKKQLASYIDISDEDESKKSVSKNTDEFEVSEKPETELFVNDVPDYANDVNNLETEEFQYAYTEKYEAAKFSESELKKSNLAILKQLKSYKIDNVKKSTVIVSKEKEDNRDDSDILISNIDQEDDTQENSKIKFRKKSKITFNENDFHDETAELEDDEDEDEDDEYGSERVVFRNEPQYFTESFEVKSGTAAKDNEAKKSNLESSIDEVEIIEEIEISDDGKVIASSVSN